jgi:hypothetical protein
MLGPIGPIAKKTLERFGYELSRPTGFERSLTRSYWQDWFGTDPALFAKVYEDNRRSLGQVESWASEIDNSLWRYGVPPMWSAEVRELGQTSLDEIEPEVTYSDLIGFIASKIVPLRYLEIGVSVGKNFWQIVNSFPEAEIYGLDVEDPNPSLVRLFDRVEIASEGKEQVVDTLSGSPATIRLTHYRLHRKGGKPVTYVKGDQFAPETWESMSAPFNLIFSDGVHSGDALRSEFDHLKRCKLLHEDGPFVMYWDDLVNEEMQSAFDRNARAMGGGWHGLYRVHGTYGLRRLNGIYSNFRC